MSRKALTILCSSTIIHNVMLYCQPDPTLAVGFFYFDFNDSKKTEPENLIKSLIIQLSLQSRTSPTYLDTLYQNCNDGQQRPSSDSLMLTFREMVGDFREVFIIVDALDECEEREKLMEMVTTIVGWKLEHLHLLLTSRREKEIMDAFDPLVTCQISIQDEIVNADIQIHIRNKLQTDNKLSKWSTELQSEIESTLMDGAHGM